MRIAALVLAPVLSACSVQADPPPDPSAMIECALDGASEFAATCFVERTQGDDGDELTVRHEDGGFRRFVFKADGTGLETAAGVAKAVNTAVGDQLEVQVEDDRYRFPAALDQVGAE